MIYFGHICCISGKSGTFSGESLSYPVLEAYLASFNAARRERGEVPDIPEAAWAWERLLAFFAGEPALVFSMNT